MVRSIQLSFMTLFSVVLLFINSSVMAQTQLMLGESFTLNLHSKQTHQDYQKLDLTPLKAHFALDDSTQTSDRIRLRLTPYQAGRFTIPHLESGELVIPAQTIEVIPNPLVEIDWGAPESRAYQNQWLSWKIQVELQDAGLPVRLQTRLSQAIQLDENPVEQQITQQKSALFIQAQRLESLGEQTLISPEILVQNRQGGRWQFFAPPTRVVVQAIPSYLPADLGLGHFELSAQRPFFNLTGELNRLQVKLKVMDGNYLPDLRPMIQTSQAIEWLNPQRTLEQTIENASSQSSPGLVMTQTIVQPYRIKHSGLGQFNQLRLNVLNPVTGKLEVLELAPQYYLALPKWAAWLLGLVIFILAMGLVYWLGRGVLIVVYRLRLSWQLKRAHHPAEIWQAYQSWGRARGLGTPQTHQAWLSAYQQRFGRNTKLIQHFNALDQQLYRTKSNLDVAESD